jgi:hypothetical protein
MEMAIFTNINHDKMLLYILLSLNTFELCLN